ncbi:host-nuclease inhibitor Gam family protein [Cloacibacillus evryensis]|uniref:host-nuclease inhibitor Gam family protein n=1 Tax=Cloacibacillus evryensis TaxID=508460 RepID=UPI00210A74FA|nr:host-nuclease inhibitor Gam family protein [Cloacibacillus evryensis]MCQ4765380.1 host-nuclease inhibitor Gam family protein [Cloacibacillus evryensis]
MARVKPKTMQPIRTVEEANDAMKEYGELKRITQDIESRLNDDIAALKAEAAEEAAQHNTRMAALENGLTAFSEAHKTDIFKDKRSLTLDYGTLGYRKSTELGTIKGSTWKTVLGKLKELAFKEAIRIKEEPDKEIIGQWPEERLALIGCERKEKDTFWFELDEAKIARLI